MARPAQEHDELVRRLSRRIEKGRIYQTAQFCHCGTHVMSTNAQGEPNDEVLGKLAKIANIPEKFHDDLAEWWKSAQDVWRRGKRLEDRLPTLPYSSERFLGMSEYIQEISKNNNLR
jgi:hypothetical protein